MPRIAFQKPRKVEWEILTEQYGRLVAEPFEKGYALTVGNSLRRTLLSIIPGAAVTWARVKGVKEVETPLPGVAESTQDVLLNLKKLAVNVPSGEPMETRLEANGPKAVTGADVSEATGVEVLNPELHIATLEAGATLAIDLGIGVGRGYVSADRHPAGSVPAGAIALDAAFSPIQRVAYNVENARLGKITDYDRLVVEVWTNGAVSPESSRADSSHRRTRTRPSFAARWRAGSCGGPSCGDCTARCRAARPIAASAQRRRGVWARTARSRARSNPAPSSAATRATSCAR